MHNNSPIYFTSPKKYDIGERIVIRQIPLAYIIFDILLETSITNRAEINQH